MKSTFMMTPIVIGIALFGLLFVACGSDDAEEPARPSSSPCACSVGGPCPGTRSGCSAGSPAAASTGGTSESSTGPDARTSPRRRNGK